jgi:hypothetical protein
VSAECGRYGCGTTVVYFSCPIHGSGCTCQYGDLTPKWYICVKTCPIHAAEYTPSQAPVWWDVARNEMRP